VGALEVGLEVVELRRPEAAVAIEEAVELGDAVALEGVDAALAVGGDVDEASVEQHLEVPRHRRLRQRGQGIDEIAGGPRTGQQQVEQRAAARVGDGGKGVHAGFITNQSYECQRI
jgi:hypothetical protein